tara:strand:+ start:511 stop:912 length:402 start_codon:yes stop_codon:yes gene_type:complete
MDSFYNTVLMVALVLLILGLAYTGYLLYYYGYAGEVWPKSKGACPDTWIEMGKDDQGRQKCVLGYKSPNLGRDDFASNNPNASTYKEINGNPVYTYNTDSGTFTFDKLPKCDLKAWADINKITWDGITNYNNC